MNSIPTPLVARFIRRYTAVYGLGTGYLSKEVASLHHRPRFGGHRRGDWFVAAFAVVASNVFVFARATLRR